MRDQKSFWGRADDAGVVYRLSVVLVESKGLKRWVREVA
jgi:hypothetical protein